MNRLAAIARRHRFGQTVLFALTVCLLVGTAAVDPLLTRSFSHAVVSFHARAEGDLGGQVLITANSLSTQSPQTAAELTSIPRLEKLLDPRVRPVVGSPVVSTYGNEFWHETLLPITVQSTVGQCRHVALVQGRCPTAEGEVLMSQPTFHRALTGLHLGSVVTLGPTQAPTRLRIVGVYTLPRADRFWRGVDVARFSPDSKDSVATLLGTPRTVEQSVPVTASVSYPVLESRLTPASLASAAAGARAMEKRGDVNVFESLNQVYDATRQDVQQVRRILPFLLVQLGVVLLILLVQVTSFFATVRRGEAAVLKMRGNGTAGVVRLGAAEFLPAAVAGAVGGLGLAYAVDGFVRHWWLPGSVAAQWSWSSLLVAAGMAVLIGAVWLVCWWLTARASISALLRARPPRRRGVRLSTPAAVLGAVCLVGVVLTATRSLTGAPVQITPVLLAGLVAIVVGALLAPAASWLVRRLLTRRRSAAALAVAQLGRRAGVVTAVTTLIITSALLTLSVSVFVRGADNRAARTAADLGATSLVHVSTGPGSASGQDLIDAVTSLDPQHREFAPAVMINASTPMSNAILGVIPSAMQHVGSRTGLQQQVPWSALGTGTADGRPAALIATWTTETTVGATVSAPTMADVDGDFTVVGAAPYIPGVGARTIVVDLKTMLAAGDRQDNVSFQVFAATQDPHRLAQLEAAVRKAGFASIQVQTTEQVRAGYDATATAWAMNLSIVVSVLAVLAALTSVVLVAVASRTDRRRDLRALRTGGVPRAVLRRATVGEFVMLALIGGLIGAATAPLASRLTGPTMLWWSTPPEQPVTRTGFQWPVGAAAAAALVVLLVVVGAAFGSRLARSAEAAERGRLG